MNYRTPNIHLRRFTLRPDGFVSLHASRTPGVWTSRPIRFRGNRLEINYATSAAGQVRVEILDARSKPIDPFSGPASLKIFGDEIRRVVEWAHTSDLSPLAGKPVRLRFHMQEADLYSFKFFDASPRPPASANSK
jgi:hypothetical protein